MPSSNKNGMSKRDKKLARRTEKNQNKLLLNHLYTKEAGVDLDEAKNVTARRKRELLEHIQVEQQKQLRALAWISYGNLLVMVILWYLRLWQVAIVRADVKLFLGFLSGPAFVIFAKVLVANLMKYPVRRNYGQKRDTWGVIPLIDDPPRLALYTAVTAHVAWFIASLFDGGELKLYLTGSSEKPRTALGAVIVSSVPTVLGIAISCLSSFAVHTVCVNKWWGYGERHKLAFFNTCSMVATLVWVCAFFMN